MKRTPCSAPATGEVMVSTRSALPVSSTDTASSSPFPAASSARSTPPGAAARTRSARPSPYVTGIAPSSRRYAWLPSLAVPTTVIPRARANCSSSVPTPPAAPCTSSVSPGRTPSRPSARSAVSAAVGIAAASSQLSPAGLWASNSTSTRACSA